MFWHIYLIQVNAISLSSDVVMQYMESLYST